MDKEYIQNLRYKLQKRFRRLNSVENNMFHSSLKQFWGFLNRYPIFLGILEELERQYSPTKSLTEEIVTQKKIIVFNDELVNAAAGYFIIKQCIESTDDQAEATIGFIYKRSYDEAVESFRSMFVEPLYEYIDERLDDQKAFLALLRRYKHKCEWFQRDQLYRLLIDDTKHGEKNLALDLYEFLYDQGLDFMIEPWSISGEADLVSAQAGDEPLIADAKIFNPESGRGKEYIVKGFNQLYQYTLDYNETFGYLIIYKTCPIDLKFALSDQEQFIPFIIHNNKTIFILTIDIFPHEKPASKRSGVRTMEITGEDLIKIEAGT